MPQIHTFNRVTSYAVIIALVAVAAFSLVCLGVEPHGVGHQLAGSGGCAVHPHDSAGTVAAAINSPEVSKSMLPVPSVGIRVAAATQQLNALGGFSVEPPPPIDPRHGRISV
jgi:hypothetical protein